MAIRTRRHQEVHNIITQEFILNRGEVVSKVGKQCTVIGANRVKEVMHPMQRMTRTCNMKLMS